MSSTSTRAIATSLLVAALGAAGLLPVAPAFAQARLVSLASNGAGAVRVVQGRAETIQLPRGFIDIVVGDPEVADVMPVTDRTMSVLGKKLGSTNVSVFDASKALIAVIDVEVSTPAGRIAGDVARVAPGDAARVGTANGRTVLQGTVRDGVAAHRAVAAAKQYNPDVLNQLQVRGPQQVMLEVRFVEASRNAGRDLGVNWNAVGKNYGSPSKAAMNFASAAGTGGLAGGTPFGTIIGRVLSNGVEADVLVQALEERGLARRLAEPNLIAMSGEKASFLAGGEYPIPVQADQGRIAIDYKRFGVGLTFTPTVLANGVINLRIEPEVSQLDTANAVRTAGISVPALIVRRASTVVELRDGQSFAIAGLLQSISSEQVSQLPWLADVPVIGALLRSSSFERKETDLAIIVTPHLVKPARPGERLRSPLDATQPGNDLDLFLNGRPEVARKDVRPVSGKVAARGGHILDLTKEARRGTTE